LQIDRERLSKVAQNLGLRMVVLFGSMVKGGLPPGPDSDVDVAVLGCPRGRFWECWSALEETIPGNSLDLALLEAADPLFRHEIMSRAELLWGDPDLFYEYRAYAYRDFVDSADLRALEQRLFQRKMAWIGGQLNDQA
jgi:predicted nucleotidyltransferase